MSRCLFSFSKSPQQFLDGRGVGIATEAPEAVPVLAQGVAEGLAAELPARDGPGAFPAAFAFAFQVDPTAERRAVVAVGEKGPSAFRAGELEEFGVLQGAADKGAERDGVWGHFGDPAAAVGHLQVEGDEVETVVVSPVVETGEDLSGMPVEELGVVCFHGTDFF